MVEMVEKLYVCVGTANELLVELPEVSCSVTNAWYQPSLTVDIIHACCEPSSLPCFVVLLLNQLRISCLSVP